MASPFRLNCVEIRGVEFDVSVFAVGPAHNQPGAQAYQVCVAGAVGWRIPVVVDWSHDAYDDARTLEILAHRIAVAVMTECSALERELAGFGRLNTERARAAQ